MRELSLTKLSAAMIFTLSVGSLALLVNTNARADNKQIAKDAIAVDTVKSGEIKSADTKIAETKPVADADFTKLDGNADGKISLKEAVKDKALSTHFDAADINHDGVISAEEYAGYKTASAAKAVESAPAVN